MIEKTMSLGVKWGGGWLPSDESINNRNTYGSKKRTKDQKIDPRSNWITSQID